MKLPNCHNAFIPTAKITRYLLDLTHPQGKSKAIFYHQIGYSLETADLLKNDLITFACVGEVTVTEQNTEGIKYVVEGNFSAINGRDYPLKSVWIIENSTTEPRLVTAYPNR